MWSIKYCFVTDWQQIPLIQGSLTDVIHQLFLLWTSGITSAVIWAPLKLGEFLPSTLYQNCTAGTDIIFLIWLHYMFNGVNFELVSEKSSSFTGFKVITYCADGQDFKRGWDVKKGENKISRREGSNPPFYSLTMKTKRFCHNYLEIYFSRYILSGALKVIKKSGMQW